MKEKECNCNKDCTCGCEEGKECTCNNECTCGCQEGKSCTCEKESKKNKKNKDKELIALLSEKEKELEDQLLRSKAEFQNYRKRVDEESLKFKKYANEDLVKELLPIVDNFERAIALDDDNLSDELSKLLEGFKMTYCSLLNVLEKYGVKAIDGNNKMFDPTYHQAVMTEKHDDMEKGFVIEVLQKGYLLNGKVIRHAMVKVNE